VRACSHSKAIRMRDMFARGLSRDEVARELGTTAERMATVLSDARAILGEDLPGAGARWTSPGGTGKQKEAPRLQTLKRCRHCDLLLQADGSCIDCPGDPERLTRRRSLGETWTPPEA